MKIFGFYIYRIDCQSAFERKFKIPPQPHPNTHSPFGYYLLENGQICVCDDCNNYRDYLIRRNQNHDATIFRF